MFVLELYCPLLLYFFGCIKIKRVLRELISRVEASNFIVQNVLMNCMVVL